MFEEMELFMKLFEGGIDSIGGGGMDLPMQSDSPKAVLADSDSYLHKQDRIVSLAREKFLQYSRAVSFTDMEKRLFEVKITAKDDYKKIVSLIARQVVRPLLAAFKEEGDEAHRMLMEMVPEHIQVKIFKKPYSEKAYARYSKGIKLEDGDPLVFVEINEEGFAPLQTFGATTAHGKSGKNVLFKDGTCLSDIGELFAYLVLLHIIEKEYKRIALLGESEKQEDQIYREILQLEEQASDNLKRYKAVFVCASSRYGKVPGRLASLLYEELGDIVCPAENTEKARLTARENNLRSSEYLCFSPIYSQNVYAAFGTKLGYFSYHDFLSYHERSDSYWAVPASWKIGLYLERAFKVVYKVRSDQNAFLREMEESKKEHARSFQTKKNIPQKTLQAMEKSLLNCHFGFVEYDADCDLEKAKEVEKEVLAFIESYTPFVDSSDNQIRFRKLGNHKATGLYYPFFKCLCVDIRKVSSFVHEYGHLIDYEYGCLSEKYSFKEVADAYESYLKGLTGATFRGKYDMNYYLKPTEIFARSFEIYVSKVLGVHNSLLPDTFTSVYPTEDEAYMDAVNNYFACFFAGYRERKAS